MAGGCARRAQSSVPRPAGWGTSALLASWFAQHPARDRCGWFSAENADNDPGRFWTYVLAALAAVRPDLGDGATQPLSAPGTTALGDVVPALLNNLAEQPEAVTPVIDDYQTVTHARCRTAWRCWSSGSRQPCA